MDIYTLCVKKNIPNISDYNSKKNYRILIILLRIFQRQLDIKSLCSFPPHPTSVFLEIPCQIGFGTPEHCYRFVGKWVASLVLHLRS